MRFKPFKIKLKQVLIKNYVVFKIELHKIRSKGNSFFLEKLGYYNTDPFRKIISINTYRLGFWLNRGAKLNLKVYAILKKYLAKSKK